MSVKAKPSLSEVLARPNGLDRSDMMRRFADLVDRVASSSGSTELQAWQVMKPLNETLIGLRCLKAEGLPIYWRDGVWYIDSRAFRKWATNHLNFNITTPEQRPGRRNGALF